MTKPTNHRIVTIGIALLLTVASVPGTTLGLESGQLLGEWEMKEFDWELAWNSGGSEAATDWNAYAENLTADVNDSSGTSVENNTKEARVDIVENLTSTRKDLLGGLSRSPVDFVHAGYNASHPNGTNWTAEQTNLTKVEGLTPLVDAVKDLHKEIGDPLNLTELTELKEDADHIDSDVKRAIAYMAYGTIDALHYTKRAFADVNDADIRVVSGNETVLHMFHRQANWTANANGTPVLNMTEDREKVWRATQNLTAAIHQKRLWQAVAVLSHAHVDAVKTLPDDLSGGGVEEANPECAGDDDLLVYSSPDCAIVVGNATNTSYTPMRVGTDKEERKFEMNWVLMDLGGNDTYNHRAGGGHGCPQGTDPAIDCGGDPPSYRVQTHTDVGAGEDQYNLTPEKDEFGTKTDAARQGPVFGSGEWGTGFLFDGGGNDTYTATLRPSKKEGEEDHLGLAGMGSGWRGAGLFIDDGGNDSYRTLQKYTVFVHHAYGAGQDGGIGLMADTGGEDEYEFALQTKANDNQGDPTDGGGAQGYGAAGGVGILVDSGTSQDTYVAGQGLVQGASSIGGFGLLLDSAGANDRFIVNSTWGCPDFPSQVDPLNLYSECDVDHQPVAGWSQGYADMLSYTALLSGDGNDRFRVNDFDGDGSFRRYEAVKMLGAGNGSGVSHFWESAGDDTYHVRNTSHGYASAGFGAFLDTGGKDTYGCARVACHGSASSVGLGIFSDVGGDEAVTTERKDVLINETELKVWTHGTLGIGANR